MESWPYGEKSAGCRVFGVARTPTPFVRCVDLPCSDLLQVLGWQIEDRTLVNAEKTTP